MFRETADEVELKLELTLADADLLEASGLFEGDPVLTQQESVYFDTPGHDLSHAGLSLRIRRNGKRQVQTVKADRSAAGILVRAEWERDVVGVQPVVDDETPVASILGEQAAVLTPVFLVENERRIWNHDGIEIALDRGRIIAGERSAPLCEVELERKNGDLAGLFGLARKIDAVVPGRICVLSKAERGYRLLGPTAQAIKAVQVELRPEMTAADSFRTIASACLGHFHRNVPTILDHADAGALHQARVAIRRFRSALSIFKAMLADERTVARLNRELRWLAGRLGAAREIDVLIERTQDGALLTHLMAARAKAYGGAGTALRSKRCRTLMLDLAEWIALGDWLSDSGNAERRDQPVCDFTAQALGHRRKVLKKRGCNLAELDDETRHEVRKAAKKMRYAADFFGTLYTRKRQRHHRKRFVRALEALQDHLGQLNDLAVGPEVMYRLGLADVPQAAAAVADQSDKSRLLAAATEALHDFVAAKPYWK